jgi:predicted transcriptional regulator
MTIGAIMGDLSENDTIERAETNIIELAVDIISAYVGKNPIPMSELSKLIGDVHSALALLDPSTAPVENAEPLKPAFSVRQSIKPDYLICLEDGKHFKSLRRHLTAIGMSAEQYREKWGLPPDYPMVAPNYAKERSNLAKELGFGDKRRGKKA